MDRFGKEASIRKKDDSHFSVRVTVYPIPLAAFSRHKLLFQIPFQVLKGNLFIILNWRKSIYDDMNQLIDFGYDIILVKSRVNGGYYLTGRDFELAELKLLVEVVQSSKFLILRSNLRYLCNALHPSVPKESSKCTKVLVSGSSI